MYHPISWQPFLAHNSLSWLSTQSLLSALIPLIISIAGAQGNGCQQAGRFLLDYFDVISDYETLKSGFDYSFS